MKIPMVSAAVRWGIRAGLAAGLSAGVHAFCQTSNNESYFYQTLRARCHFDEVEYISRNHDFGEWRGGAINLRPFVRLTEFSVLGLDESGRLLQVIRGPDRTIAFLLSGERKLVDLFYLADRSAVVIDHEGELLIFDRTRWETSPRERLRRRIMASFGLTSLGLGASLGYVGIEWQLPVLDVLVPGIPAGVALALQHALFYAMSFSEENNNTDGLKPIGRSLTGYQSAEGLDVKDQRARDYVLHAANESISLKEFLASVQPTGPQLFEDTCEANLARGYPLDLSADTTKTERPHPRLLGRRE